MSPRVIDAQNMSAIVGILTLCCMLFLIPNISSAQSFIGGSNDIQLTTDTQFPEPNTSVQISLNDYTVETVGATIQWYVDGVEKTESRNDRSITVTTGGVGVKTTLRAVVSRTNGPQLSASLSIIPNIIDIILETNTYIPSFYKGKALPSEESPLRAIAVVHDNSSTPDNSYVYKWSIGTTVLSGGPLKGKNVLEFTPPRYTSGGLTVEVFDTSGTPLGKKTIPLSRVAPELHFYEHNPLRGLYEREITSPHALIGDETTIYGEPFFINTQALERDANFEWEIDGTDTSSDPGQPNTITLRHVGGVGNAQIDLRVLTKSKIPQLLGGSFQLLFE